jgi:chondroitin AC lyase
MALTAGTQWQPPAAVAGVACDWMLNGNAWMSVRDVFDFGVVGRSVSRPGGDAIGIAYSSAAVRMLAGLVPARAADLLAYADRLDGHPAAPPLTGNRHFWTSDYVTHRRPTWSAALRMHSVRTVASECDNGENLKGEHLADGVLNTYAADALPAAGSEYWDVFPLLDWNAIGGITVEHDTPLLTCGPQTGDVFPILSTSFVGGVSDGEFGAAAMDTATHNLTARRAWFMLDGGILGLGVNITDPSPADVWTTLVSRNLHDRYLTVGLRDGSVRTLMDGNYSFNNASSGAPGALAWVHADNQLWLPSLHVDPSVPAPDPVLVSAWNRSGRWQDIGANTGDVSGRVLQVSLQHGVLQARTPAQYAYFVAPNVSLANAAAVAAAVDGIAGVVNTAAVQGLVYATASMAQVVVWEAGAVYNSSLGWTPNGASPAQEMAVSADAPCLLVVRQVASTGSSGAQLVVSASNPDQPGLTLQVVVHHMAATGAGCEVTAEGTGLSFSLPSDADFQGQSQTIVCDLQ